MQQLIETQIGDATPARASADHRVVARTAEYPAFDWLRFALASTVALGHEGLIPSSDITGNLAVQVFFALSGWLIGNILLNTNAEGLPQFFFNRATRIWIPYFFSVFFIYALSAVREPVTLHWLTFLFYDLTFTHNWFTLRPDPAIALAEMPLKGTGNGFWSIAVEEQFYLVAPLLIIYWRYGRNPLSWAFIAMGLWIMQLTDFVSISLGVLSAAIYQLRPNFHLDKAFVAIAVAILIISVIVLVKVSYVFGAPLFAIAVVLLCARPGSRGGLGMLAGAVSFPMYLNHWMGAFLVNGVTKRLGWPNYPTANLLSYVLGVMAGALAWWCIDRNVMANRKKLYARRLGIMLAATAYTLITIGTIAGLLLLR